MSSERHLLFLSHAGADSDAAVRLAKRIEATPIAQEHKLSVWLDKRDLSAGAGWKKQLEQALRDSTAFAVYIGSNGVMNWVRDEVDVALDRAHGESAYPVIPVLSKDGDVKAMPGFLGQYQGVFDVENDGDAFARLLKGVLRLDARQEIALEQHPFQGLGAFTTNRAHLFCGRANETKELVKLLRVERLVMVVGDSGSGKSSLIKAGLVPAFLGGAMGTTARGPDETIWHAVQTRPLSRPFRKLAQSTAEAAKEVGKDADTRRMIRDLVRSRDPENVRDALIESAPSNAKILLVVDQFEELLTLSDEETRAPYVDMLMSIADPAEDRIRIVLTMRRDYYNLISEFEAFYDRLERQERKCRYSLNKMTRVGMRKAVMVPLRKAGVGYDQAKVLANAIVRDVGDQPSDLALLEMALTRTWDARQSHGGDLLRAYQAIGRVDGALANAAENVFQGKSPENDPLTDEERQRAEVLFIRLVRLGDTGGTTRRLASKDEFSAEIWELAQKLAEAEFERLVVVRGEDEVEIAHEALVTQWPRYQRWLQNRGEDLRADDKRRLDRLMDRAAAWRAAKRKGEDTEAQLATGATLDQLLLLANSRMDWLSESEKEFIRLSDERGRAVRVAKELENQFITQVVDSDRLRDCLVEGDSLWPADPRKLEALESLKRSAVKLRDTVGEKRTILDRITESLEKAGTPRLRWQRDFLSDLVLRIESLGDPNSGLIASLERRLAFARTVEGLSIQDHQADWDRTIARIRLSDKYSGLVIEPQIGLIPLGKDPDSGLCEFLHLQTHDGPLPKRDETGRLAITEATGIIFVLLPGGSFWMGAQSESPDVQNYDPNAEESEMPPHEVTLAPFFMSKFLMTQGQWLRFSGQNPSHYQPGFEYADDVKKTKYTLLHPVEEITWSESLNVLRKLGLRLPTEAQWEYAARGGTSTVYWTGDNKESIRRGAHLLYNDLKLRRHAPVDRYAPNGFGLHDVIGNLWEFTADQYGSYKLGVDDGDGRRKVEGSKWLVIRGCSFFNSAEQARIAYRTDDCEENKKESWMGVRPARLLSPAADPRRAPADRT